MNLLKRSALTVSLMAMLNLPGAVLAQEAPQQLEAAPATAAAPAPMDDMQAMRERMQEMMQSKGMGPGTKCNKRDGQGPGMMMQGGGMGAGKGMGAGMEPMGQGKNCDRRDGKGPGMGKNCDRRGDGGCDVSQRLDDLEKRMDMMQMMMKMMMR